MNWLVKEEPSHYNFEQFQREKNTTWTGVKNALAQKHLRSMRAGDRVFYYHTGDEKAVVGIAKVVGAPRPDPDDASGKAHVVDLAPVRRLPRPVTLAEIKADRFFDDFALTRVPRLSVMPVTDEQWERIERIAT